MSLMQAAAQSAFWSFEKPLLDKICAEVGIAVLLGSPLFDMLMTMTVATLPNLSEDDALLILGNRLDVASATGTNLVDLLELEEATACLGESERKEFQEEHKNIVSAVATCKAFKTTWVRRRASVAAAANAKAAAKPKPRRQAQRGPAKAQPRPQPRRELPAGVIHQQDAILFCPPGRFVWRGNQAHSWSGHCPPYSRISRSWHLYGGNRAAPALVLQTLWRQHLEYHGKSFPQDCDVDGLFEPGTPRRGQGRASDPEAHAQRQLTCVGYGHHV